VSVEPPAGHGTISVIGRVGKSCARACVVARPSAASAAAAMVVMVFIGLSPPAAV
jgi:hypothetical protein